MGVAPTDPDFCFVTDYFRTYSTHDGGRSWQQNFTVKKGENAWTTRGLDVTTCYGVHFDPFDANRVFISYTDIGLFRSEDGGQSWISSVEGVPAGWRNTTYWLQFDPAVKGLLWGAFSGTHDLPRPKMWVRGDPQYYRGGVGVSTDGGLTWTAAGTGMPQTAVTHLLLDPTSPVGKRTLYACGFGTGLWKSTDNGQTWALKNTGPPGPPLRLASHPGRRRRPLPHRSPPQRRRQLRHGPGRRALPLDRRRGNLEEAPPSRGRQRPQRPRGRPA